MSAPDFNAFYFSRTHIPMLVIDSRGMPLQWNKATERLLLDEAPDTAGRNLRDILLSRIHPEDNTRLQKMLAENQPFFTFDVAIQTEESGPRWVKLIGDRLKNGYYLAALDDITPEKTRENSLVLAKETAEKASITRSQFLANISHEIRTPIQTIIGMMDLLTDTKLDEEQTEYARQVRFSADVMLTLINDILDFSKIEAGQMHIEEIEFDLLETIERSVDLVTMEAYKKGLEVIIDVDPLVPKTVIGDPHRLQQIILNLVKNAVKFTPSGEVLVKAGISSAKHESGGKVRFEIIDTGIGIKPEIKGKLFNQFMQADSSTTRKFGGTGLGLAISRNIVELMNGSIGIADNPAGGSIFWFEIPFTTSSSLPLKRQQPERPDTRFLLVDDNPHTLSVLARMLVSIGYRDITVATTGPSALDKMLSANQSGKPFELVLIDMIMPEMDGWRLAGEINRNREINQSQLFLMVPEGSFGADAKMKLLEWFNGYLYKPVKRRMLEELLQEHLQASIDLEVVDEAESLEEPDKAPAPPHEITLPVEITPPRAPPPHDEILAHDKPAENTAAAETEKPGAGITVLVAEDHPVNRKLLTVFLEKAGAAVIQAEDGQEAVEAIQAHPVDVIFMDIQMPRMNGYEAAVWMRNKGHTVPIIACTASAQQDEKEKCLDCGMNDVLPKPYKRQDAIDMMITYGRQYKETQQHNALTGVADDHRPNAAAPEHMAPDPEVFDPFFFSDIMMGDLESAKALIGEYLEQTESHLAILAEDLASGNSNAASQTAHLIKGSSVNITAKRLADAAEKIEHAGSVLTNEQKNRLLAEVHTEFERLGKALAAEGYR